MIVILVKVFDAEKFPYFLRAFVVFVGERFIVQSVVEIFDSGQLCFIKFRSVGHITVG